MIDTDMDGNFASDLNGTPLSLREIREHYISGEQMQYHPRFKKVSTKVNEHYAYMAKNTYWFSSAHSRGCQEPFQRHHRVPG